MFIECAAFDGAKPGYAFRMGDEGLGYYRDATAASNKNGGGEKKAKPKKTTTKRARRRGRRGRRRGPAGRHGAAGCLVKSIWPR